MAEEVVKSFSDAVLGFLKDKEINFDPKKFTSLFDNVDDMKKVIKTYKDNEDIGDKLVKDLFSDTVVDGIKKGKGISSETIDNALSSFNKVANIKDSVFEALGKDKEVLEKAFNKISDEAMDSIAKYQEDGIGSSIIKEVLTEEALENKDIIGKDVIKEAADNVQGFIENTKALETMEQKAINKNRYKSIKDYIKYKKSGSIQADLEAFDKGGEIKETMLKGHGLNDNTSREALQYKLGKDFQGHIDSPTLLDKAGYHKVPQRAVGAGSLAFLVQNMSDRRGQLSNAELYGQAPPYQGPPQGGGYY